MSISEWMNEQIMVYLYHGILLSSKIEQTIDLCIQYLEWTARNNTKKKQSISNGYVLYDSNM